MTRRAPEGPSAGGMHAAGLRGARASAVDWIFQQERAMAAETKKRLVGHIILDVHAGYASVSRFIETSRCDLVLQVATYADELATDEW